MQNKERKKEIVEKVETEVRKDMCKIMGIKSL